MTKSDIRDYRRWHRNAALRARRAGFNIVCNSRIPPARAGILVARQRLSGKPVEQNAERGDLADKRCDR